MMPDPATRQAAAASRRLSREDDAVACDEKVKELMIVAADVFLIVIHCE